MLTVARRFLLLLAVFGSPPVTAGIGSGFSEQIVALRAASYLMPRTTLERLRALEQASQPLTPVQQGQVLEVAVNAQFWLRDPEQGLRLVGEIERLATVQHDRRLRVMALVQRGYIASKKLHDAALARKLFSQAEKIAAATDDVYVQVEGLVVTGLVDAEDGKPAAGLPSIDRAVVLARAADDRDALIMALKAQATVLADLKRFDAALASVDQLLALTKRRGLPVQVVRAELTDSDIAARAGHAARAREALRAAVSILETLQASECLPRVLVRLAELESRAGNYAEAGRVSERARSVAASSGDLDEVALAEFEAGVTRIYSGQLALGQRMAERGLAHFRDDETYVPMMLSYAQALGVAGAPDAALKVYAEAGSVGLMLWRKDRERARESVIKAAEMQKKESENEALSRENEARQAELRSARKLARMWWVFSAMCAFGCVTTAVLYRRVRVSNRSLRTLNDVLYMQSTSDALTGLRNRNFFYEYVTAAAAVGRTGEQGEARDPDQALAGTFFLLDVDHFKVINDTYGHAVGDEVLRAVSGRIAACVRVQDVLVRWGGEEFLVFMPGVSAAAAQDATRRLLAAVGEDAVDTDGGAIGITMSVGFSVASADSGGAALRWEQHVHLADLALYRAKADGRNRAYGVYGALTPDTLAAVEQALKRGESPASGELCSIPGPIVARPGTGRSAQEDRHAAAAAPAM